MTVIVSTFDRPGALRRVLEGYGRSRFRDFEVIVADDGSGPETAAVVTELAKDAPYRLRHTWQPHHGFRLAAARNLAARSACGEVLVLTDGDCVPFEDTLEPHAERCAPGRAQSGARCLLDEAATRQALADPGALVAIGARVRLAEAGRLRRQSWKDFLYRRTGLKARPKLVTANAAVHRHDFARVNGFDERFIGWGYEDEDLARRLRRTGVKVLDACRRSLVLHLFHPVHESHRPDARAGANYRYFQRREYLTRPLAGLRARPVEDLSLELLGDVPPALRGLPGAGDPEVSLVFGSTPRTRARPRGEVTIAGLDPAGFAGPAELYRLLACVFGPLGD